MSALRDSLRDLPDAVFADLLESEDAYVLVVDLPGATAETTEISAEDGRLAIDARREKATPEGFRYVREDRPLFLDAELPLPPDADGTAADAGMERGVLEVTLPKRDDERSKPIPIEEGEEADDEGDEGDAVSVNDTGEADEVGADDDGAGTDGRPGTDDAGPGTE